MQAPAFFLLTFPVIFGNIVKIYFLRDKFMWERETGAERMVDDGYDYWRWYHI